MWGEAPRPTKARPKQTILSSNSGFTAPSHRELNHPQSQTCILAATNKTILWPDGGGTASDRLKLRHPLFHEGAAASHWATLCPNSGAAARIARTNHALPKVRCRRPVRPKLSRRRKRASGPSGQLTVPWNHADNQDWGMMGVMQPRNLTVLGNEPPRRNGHARVFSASGWWFPVRHFSVQHNSFRWQVTRVLSCEVANVILRSKVGVTDDHDSYMSCNCLRRVLDV